MLGQTVETALVHLNLGKQLCYILRQRRLANTWRAYNDDISVDIEC
jgi:hypothetical protein